MKSYVKSILFGVLVLTVALNAFGRWVTEEEVISAANSTLSKPILQEFFPLATVKSVSDIDGLWCVNLSPKGHMIFSGSTKQMPLLKYSKGDYTVPTKGNPRFQIENGMRSRAKSLESASLLKFATFAVESTPEEVEWENLLNPISTFSLRATQSTSVKAATTVDLNSDDWNPNWSQWEPWNDFCPQLGAESEVEGNDIIYGFRAPVGCVATMYSQIMKYYEWPQRIDGIYSKSLQANNSALGNQCYEMRFHGGLPIEWNTLKDDYWRQEDGAWGKLYESEIERQSVARLGLLTDIMSSMVFDNLENDGSGAPVANACINDWYELGSPNMKGENDPFTSDQLTEIKKCLESKMPLPAGVPGHAVFIYGYKSEGTKAYLKINYGWANDKNDDESDSNGFYLADEAQIDTWFLGHAPKVQIQVAPLPKVVNVNSLPTVMWMVPEYHEGDFTGFTVSATPYSSTEMVDYKPTIDALKDLTVDEEDFKKVTLQDENENTVEALAIKATVFESEVYTFPEAFIPSKDTVFTCDITDIMEEGTEIDTAVNIQLWNEVDMEWKTLVTFPHENESGEIVVPGKAIIPLGRYAERFCRMRLTLSSIDNGEDDGEEEGEGEGEEEEKKMCYAISNIAFSNVYKQGSAIKSNKLSSGVREHQLSGLATDFGTRYRIKVEGTTKEDPVHFGETFTRLTNEVVSMPIIEKVESITGEVLTDAVLLEGDLDGLSGLRVTCNDAVTELRAYSSCLTLISDDDIKVNRSDENVFDVIIKSKQTVENLDGSRMLITLEARTAQGNVVYKDITFVLRSAIQPTVVERDVDGEAIQIPGYWFSKYNLLDDEESSKTLETLANEDADKDGMLNWQEYVCGTSPVDSNDSLKIEKLLFNDDGTVKEVVYSPTSIKNGSIKIEGKVNLTDSQWNDADLSSHHFFRLRVIIE